MNVSNLHSVWDTAGIVYADFIVQPLSEEDWLYLGKQAFEISMADPYSSFDIENLTRPESEWYEETYEIARTVVYPGAI
jgi:hypothetical protein